MIDKSLMKDSMGRYRTNLFYEFNTTAHEEYPPLYTMREDDYRGLPSAYKIYMGQSSEYAAAQELVGSWSHWQRLLTCSPFMNGPKLGYAWTGLNTWRDEKEIQDRSLAYLQLKENAAGGNVQAQRIIFDGTKKRGRPSNADIKKAADERVKNTKSIKDDLERIRLVTNGNQARSS